MKYQFRLCCLFLFSTCIPCFGQEKMPEVPKTARTAFPGLQPNSQILLPNGWSLSPTGKQVPLGDFPVNVALSADGKFAAVLHCGYGSHEVRIVSLEKQTIVSTAQIDQSFYGMTFCQGDKFLAISGGEDENIYTFPFADGFLAKPKTTTLASKTEKFVVSGVSAVDSSKELIVCGLLGNEVRAISQETGDARFKLGLGEGSYPYTACINDKDKRAYISLWGASSIAVVDIASGKLLHTLPTLSHPTEMKLLDEGRHLLVSCSNQNSVVLIDTQSMQQREVIRTSLFPKGSNGSTPSSLAVSADEKVLFAANADNNNLAVFDISDRGHSKSLGFIPVGWYPTNVRIAKDGAILVANGKGLTTRANVHGANPNNQPPATIREYIGGLFLGTLSIIDPPSPSEMSKFTRTAFECSPLNEKETPNTKNVLADNPIPTEVGKPSPIKHCVYIVKENRTYDQVFGDMPTGNGDPSLCIFPERVTPNHHALASEYVLLDNFYVESEVSADGHEWTMAAYATDFVEKTWPLTYRGGRGKLGYPSEGKLKIAEPSSGYIWDKCRAHGVSYFSFGEFVENGPTIDSPATTKVEALQGHFDPKYRSYDLDYSDIKRAERFIERWNQFEQEGNLPQFMVIRLPNDHTYGTRVGKPTPTAMVADNDIALGMVVEALSKSKKWKETAIFVVEDDAQNGADHVDAHRTVALAISPYTRGAGLDSTLYSTSSMLRTMELILGMEPMTQFDASANPMYRSFKSTPDLTPYKKRDVMVDLSAKNDIAAWGAKQSAEMDLTKEDAADDLLFGDIVWRSVKGANHPMPAPVRSAFVFAEVEDE